jgi:rhodanese-related sulfurtransferase
MKHFSIRPMTKAKLSIVLILLGTFLGVRAEVVNVDPSELARLAASGVPVIDIRTAPEWKETGVLAGSKLMTFFDEKGQVDAPGWVAKLKPIAGPGQPVILICRSGNRSNLASQFLSNQVGYKTVYNASGGIQAWMKGEHPVVAPINAASQ